MLAGEGVVHALRPHTWHLEILERLASTDASTFRHTASMEVDLRSDASAEAATDWWERLTVEGGEGMVVKPTDVVHRGPKRLAQPGIKVRGREYLRIIYGPEYTAERHRWRLRARGLGISDLSRSVSSHLGSRLFSASLPVNLSIGSTSASSESSRWKANPSTPGCGTARPAPTK